MTVSFPEMGVIELVEDGGRKEESRETSGWSRRVPVTKLGKDTSTHHHNASGFRHWQAPLNSSSTLESSLNHQWLRRRRIDTRCSLLCTAIE